MSAGGSRTKNICSCTFMGDDEFEAAPDLHENEQTDLKQFCISDFSCTSNFKFLTSQLMIRQSILNDRLNLSHRAANDLPERAWLNEYHKNSGLSQRTDTGGIFTVLREYWPDTSGVIS